MSKSKGKQAEKDAGGAASAASASLTLQDITTLLEGHREALSSEFKASFQSLASKLDGVEASIKDHGDRIRSLEENANSFEQRLTYVEDKCVLLQQDNHWLREKVADLEGRSRRQNIRIVGLPENIEGPRPTAFFSQLLTEVFGDSVLPTPPEIDRAHRTSGAKPRPVILRLHRFQVKDLIIRESRGRKNPIL
ncbi:hypothetical protein NQD34_018262 [Periophthalmus magnuspinnatus]|nr:hypothetical protein NQD34_018262 [Periophthalmus magnuspinnatus]